MRSDEVPNTLPQNIAPWYTEYFNLKGFEKQQVLEGFSDSPYLLLP